MPANYAPLVRPVAIIAIAILIATGLYINRPAPEQIEVERLPLLVNAAKAVKEDIRVSVRAQGIITPRTQTTLIAEVSGRITSVAKDFKAGGFFQKGDIILSIDQRDYLANLKRAEAAVASAKSNLASEKGRAEVAYKDWVKYKSSVERSKAANDLALRKPQLEDAQAKLDSALADLDSARDQLDRTIIRAPYDGLVRSKKVDIGQYVNVGVVMAETFAIDFAELRMALPENKLNYLELPTLADRDLAVHPKVDLQAEIGGTVRQWQGKIVRTEGVFDERSRALFAVAEIDDPYGINSDHPAELRIGTFVDANIEGRLINDLIPLPRHLLRAGNYLWVIDDQQRLQNRKVNILRTEGTDIYISQGLNEGELISLSNIAGAIPGTKVRIATITETTRLTEEPALPEAAPTEDDKPLNLAPASPNTDSPALHDENSSDNDAAKKDQAV
ncbi:MAG: efflux RND transporter periplasmic adaptor subunit [Oceanicoccus sp.]|uniref:efflux RND transporter periplasmic adaptor subunit n=1 Tax=Oceanicoccus sp. TaxID=2691044 RepID=UPI00260640FA|nr:efflux RND transporter periplasmic adaptor subunit [Oceanicoccus sp.]MDG1772260.1 efflux RND transporter periplasmic adaptor subunit [Oceanicoccus sp.]